MINNTFIGTSVPMLYYVNYLIYKKKITDNIVIIELNKNKIGGSWNFISNKYINRIDSGIHFITIDDNYNSILKGFGNLNIELCKFKSENLIIEYTNYRKFLKQGLLYAKDGWANLTHKLYSNLLNNKNITFLYKKIDKINVKPNYSELYYNNNIIKTKQLCIPAYISINEVFVNNEPVIFKNDNNNNNQLKTLHLILYLKTEKIKFDENFHSIYDNIYGFDRVMFVTKNIINKSVNLICILRISRKWKKKINKIPKIHKEALYFLYFKKLINNSIIINHEITEYSYNFRYKSFLENCNNINKLLIKNNISNKNIQLLDTRDLGPLVELYN